MVYFGPTQNTINGESSWITNSIFRENAFFYHGSRSGIDGDIDLSQCSRRVDFGRGFHLNTSDIQAKTWVIDQFNPYVYTFTINFKALDDSKILYLSETEWAYTVLHNRKNCPEFTGSGLDQAVSNMTYGYDFIIGPIADDRLRNAVRAFGNNALTDEGLIACLSKIDYGTQIVAKTKKAIDCLEIINVQDSFGEQEQEMLEQYKRNQISQARNTVREIQVAYQHKGRLIDSILQDDSEVKRIEELTKKAEILVFQHENGCSSGQIVNLKDVLSNITEHNGSYSINATRTDDLCI